MLENWAVPISTGLYHDRINVFRGSVAVTSEILCGHVTTPDGPESAQAALKGLAPASAAAAGRPAIATAHKPAIALKNFGMAS